MHPTVVELDAHLEHIRRSPRDIGTLELIVRRPEAGTREVVEIAQLDVERGLVGDNWLERGSKRTPDGSAHPEQQLTLTTVRMLAAIAPRADWPLAGDQLLVDLDLSEAHLPAGSRLAIGDALIEITALPHTGCAKFTQRFGSTATAWIHSTVGRTLRLRGVNARVLRGGTIRRGDSIVCRT